jgi:hypothetical protein
MSESNSSESVSGVGCLGCFVAVFLSIKTYGFTLWIIPHFLLGWIYAAYWVILISGWLK